MVMKKMIKVNITNSGIPSGYVTEMTRHHTLSLSLLQWLLPTGASTGLDITMLDQEIQLLCEQGITA